MKTLSFHRQKNKTWNRVKIYNHYTNLLMHTHTHRSLNFTTDKARGEKEHSQHLKWKLKQKTIVMEQEDEKVSTFFPFCLSGDSPRDRFVTQRRRWARGEAIIGGNEAWSEVVKLIWSDRSPHDHLKWVCDDPNPQHHHQQQQQKENDGS